MLAAFWQNKVEYIIAVGLQSYHDHQSDKICKMINSSSDFLMFNMVDVAILYFAVISFRCQKYTLTSQHFYQIWVNVKKWQQVSRSKMADATMLDFIIPMSSF